MIDLHADQLSGLLSGVALAGGMLHKIIGPFIDRTFALLGKIVLTSLENRLMTQPGISNPTALPGATAASNAAPVTSSGTTVLSEVETGLLGALSGGTAVLSAVNTASTESAKIIAGLNAFLSFASPILEAVEPGYAALVNGIGQGVLTIVTAIETHQNNTPSKTA